MSLRALLLAGLLASTPLPALAQSAAAKSAHREAIVLDTHFDTPALLGRPGWSIMDRHARQIDGSQVDYPRMVEGGVDGGFFAIFTPQGPRTPEGAAAARDAGLLRAVAIREMVARHGREFGLALSADEALATAKAGKRFVVISMENGSPLGTDLSLMSTFHKLGVRVMGPVHTTNNDLADSATDPKGVEWKGLSPAGRQFVTEANRLGILIDGSHASDEALQQMVVYSRAPVILSHSGVRGVFDHPRNVTDGLLRLLASKGGVVQINVFSSYMIATPVNPERVATLRDLDRKYPVPRDQAQQVAYIRERAAVDARLPVPRATMDDVVNHILHAVRTVGIDYVGLSGDFDGGGGVEGLNDVTDYPKLTQRLMDEGFTKDDLGKFWGGNALRALREAEKVGEALRRTNRSN